MEIKEPASYVVKCIQVPAVHKGAYRALVAEHWRPVWQDLKRQGALASQRVFELIRVDQEATPCPAWNYVLLTRLKQGVEGRDYLSAEAEQMAARHAAVPGLERLLGSLSELRRVEVMVSTPNSLMAWPTPESRLREAEVFTWIVYVDVAQPYLTEYREIMRDKLGPPLVRAAQEGIFYDFIALETTSVESAREGMVPWNQIHLHGSFAPLNPQKIHEGYLAAMRDYLPRGPEEVYARLDKIRTMPRHDLSLELRDLGVSE